MMREQLTDARDRGELDRALWASEETIYGRYGYGLASLGYNVELPRRRRSSVPGHPGERGRLRLVDHDEALRLFPGSTIKRAARERRGSSSGHDPGGGCGPLGDQARPPAGRRDR